MTLYVGQRDITNLGFTSVHRNHALAGYTLTAKGSAKPRNDPALLGAFKALQRGVNAYLVNKKLARPDELLKVDGIIGASTLKATQKVMNHATPGVIGLDVPYSIKRLADMATVYAAKIVWAAQQGGGGAVAFDSNPGRSAGDDGKPPTPERVQTTPPDGQTTSAGAGGSASGAAASGGGTRQTASIADGGLSPMMLAGVGLLAIGGILWLKKRGA